ncbi:MAG: hypothetical protein K2H07_04270, partial [Lachnospiraceae bacterium]|nr:hypothetical protein [Lachnospiraceae bacterium]
IFQHTTQTSAPLKGITWSNLVVEYYDENYVEHENAKIINVEGNLVTYQFSKKDITGARLICDISDKAKIKDATIKEVKIDDIIRIAYRG